MIDKLLRLSFFFSLTIIIFFLGYVSHKYKAKKIFQTLEPIISSIELKLDVDFDKKFGERSLNFSSFDSNLVDDTNFSYENKPRNKFENFLFLKLDNNYPVLMSSPDKIIWRWNLDKFRNAKKLIPYILYENGDIILGRYETKGIYKIDKRGKIIWHNDLYNHHWISSQDGFLYVPGTVFLNNKDDLNDEMYDDSFIKNCKAVHKSRFGTIMIIDEQNGKLKKEISLIRSFYKKATSKKIIEKYASNCTDTLHLNDVRVLDEKKANFFNNGKKGDMLVSLRHLDMIALIDKDNYDLKWYIQGKFKNQHSPRVTDKGTLLVFDNHFESKKSRIVEIDIKTKDIVGYYSGDQYIFFSSTRGRIQLFDEKIIVQSSDQGEIFEISCISKFLNNNDCKSKYLFSSVFSGFYPNTGSSVTDGYIKDQIYIGDFYKKNSFIAQ